MLFKNLYNDHDQYRLNEGNFISKDITGLFDSDAEFRLLKLTIDKLFEGLDLEKSEELHSFIKSNMPDLSPVLGKYKASNTSAFELIRSQVSYIDTRILFIEKELQVGFDAVLAATKTNYGERKKKISEITNPSGVASIIPKIDQVVKKYMKSSTIDFKSDSIKQNFISLYKLDMSSIIKQTLTSLEQSSAIVNLKALYTKVDEMDLEKIESDTATFYAKLLVASMLEPNELIKSTDIYDRLAGFYEMVLSLFPYGQLLTTKFGKNYSSINIVGQRVGPDAIMSMNQFLPSTLNNVAFDTSIFEPMSELLNEVSSILINRVFLQSPDEDLKNIFTPSLQVMYMCMLSIVSLKLINLNLEVESLVIKTEEQIKKDAEKKIYDEKVQRVKNLLDVTNKLESMNFLKKGGLVYKVGSTKMSSEVIKLINNYFVILKFLPPYKFNDTNYDATTAEGVTKFQEAYGLKFVDGKIGNETKGEMKEVANGYKIKYNIQNVESGVMGSYGL